jgi:hypothetical protein
MAKYENNTIIMAVFENESAAVGALSGMEHWAKSRRDIKLGRWAPCRWRTAR